MRDKSLLAVLDILYATRVHPICRAVFVACTGFSVLESFDAVISGTIVIPSFSRTNYYEFKRI